MDLVATCKEKLMHFRVKELKDVLTQFGLSKQGRKQDLVDRILLVLAAEQGTGTLVKKNVIKKEEVAKLIDDIYRKMQVSGASDLASKAQAVPDISKVKPKEEIEDSHQKEEIRCLCRSILQTESMIKCEDSRCHVWQHINCVIIPENPMDGVLPKPPDSFHCELCRLSRADPFLVTVSHPLYPLKLTITSVPADGSNPVVSVEKNFQLTKMEKDMLLKQEYDVQAWCMLLNDKVPFRMQWPQYADLQVNGVPVRVINRPGSQLLGANGRDDGPIITSCTRDGINKITLTGCDTRVFCLGVRIVKRRTVQQILNMIPKEVDGEKFEDALARVRRCVGGGTAMENADSDSDIEVVAHFVPVNLRCPMSGSRMKVAGRFKPCIHMGCFDLDVFVEMNQRSRKWQCPICLKNYALENVIIDPYFNRITSKLRHFGEEVSEIEVKPDGSWRAKAEGDHKNLGELALWHFPDGSLCPPTEVESKPTLEALREVKQENGSDSHAGLKLGMKKNRNGIWEIRHPDDPQRLSSGNIQYDNFENQNVIHMSSSTSGSGKDGDDASVNQDGGGNKYFSTNNGVEFDSAYGLVDQNPSARPGDNEVIVLSDSDVEDEALIATGLVNTNNPNDGGGVQFSVPPTHGISNSYRDDSGIGAGGSSNLGLFNANDDEYAMHMWNLPTGSQGGPGFQLFGSDANVNVQNGTNTCPLPPLGGYPMTSDPAMGSGTFVPDDSAEHPSADMCDGLPSPIAFGGNDPSLQIFLPTRPSDYSAQADMSLPADVPNGVRSEDWASLRLGGSGGRGGQANPAATNGINSGEQLQPNEGAVDTLDDTASLLLGMNGSNDNNRSSSKPSRQRSDGPFSFPRQRRSVRPRYLSIDSDSN